MNAVEIISREISPTLDIQTKILEYMTDFFVKEGFKWLLPVIISPITDPLWPDPAGEGMEPAEVEIYGVKMRLTHSMILHKQLAIAMGLKKIFVLSPNIRLESRQKDDGRHAYEFTQLDFEVERAKMEDIMRLIERLVYGLFRKAEEWTGREFPKTKRFEVFEYSEVLEEFGSDEKASQEMEEPFWIINIPREFYDREVDGFWRNYDLILPYGYGEVASGGEREWEYEKIVAKIRKAGLNEDSFRPYLEIAKAGKLKPSAGAGIGVERLVRFIVGAKHIAEVQPFPRIPGIPAVI
ncbi:asparagine synthetase [Pyrococcus furiosus DSM 3638]|uniref:Asparagine synthetase n=3 Tax=Pyrococcus furiosus TaxID=2261 RepID=A0A5C0XQN1_PYRFU|nr:MULTISPECIES: asparagine synthetase A [Pyrococcus]1NNH_A Chain A, asparaginyl-tRNA synthetase-related peptide [Pyrococcus furiosus]AAL82075.1 partial asparaginyl-tRNA synthetase matches COOH terminus [Pyrococcus furiosus DSM 3638]AFN04690.1 asparagine ligase A [Pyrococcus furiosus COM1]MDK2869385.1 asparaginyl-tRNA synthetase [Pyrococcus sp.]QEK79546.1 asparagine synthetase [Pyrococcus furiosus DSM 3638]